MPFGGNLANLTFKFVHCSATSSLVVILYATAQVPLYSLHDLEETVWSTLVGACANCRSVGDPRRTPCPRLPRRLVYLDSARPPWPYTSLTIFFFASSTTHQTRSRRQSRTYCSRPENNNNIKAHGAPPRSNAFSFQKPTGKGRSTISPAIGILSFSLFLACEPFILGRVSSTLMHFVLHLIFASG